MLPGSKNEVFVSSNWPSYRESVLVTLQTIISGCEIVLRIEAIVPYEFEGGSMDFIRTTARNGIYHAATAASKLGVGAIGLEAKLPDGVRIWKDVGNLSVRIFVKAAIQIERG